MKSFFRRLFNTLSARILAGMPAEKTGINAKGDVTKFFDKHTENLIISALKKNVEFRAQVISEELDKPLVINPRASTGMHYIIIDPVDGSDNYMAKTPFVAVAVAVFDEKLRPKYSFAGNYYTCDWVYADRQGVAFNGKRIRKPFLNPPKELLILAVSDTKPKKPSEFMALVNEFDIVRSFGATAGEMLYVVKGEAKAFADLRGKLTLENFAPYFLIAEKLGLKMTDENGSDMALKSLSMTKGYKLVFSQPEYLKKITRHTRKT
jgi:fructose-1,6-bisphosphatase/inositol monophosphatase family enzyme